MVAALSISAASFAKGSDNAASWNFDINVSQLSNYLQLSSKQVSEVSDICDYFANQMKNVSYASDKNQKDKLHNAIYANLKLMKETLTEDQYKKYVRLLNVTMQNKGLEL